jgi:hypothetical protein
MLYSELIILIQYPGPREILQSVCCNDLFIERILGSSNTTNEWISSRYEIHNSQECSATGVDTGPNGKSGRKD